MAADYSLMGSFGTGGASALSGDLITKLRETEEKSIVGAIDKKISNYDLEVEKIAEIQEKLNEFLATTKYFEVGGKENVFEQVLADTSGDSVVFDAIDTTSLQEGTITISVSQLAQKDIFQSKTFADSTALVTASLDEIITIANVEFSTAGKTFEALAEEINNTEGIQASIKQVSDTEFRLVIRSTETGSANNLNISISGTTPDDSLELLSDVDNHVMEGKNLNAIVDGISYDISSNTMVLEAKLSFTAIKVDEVIAGSGGVRTSSSITISEDTSAVTLAAEALVRNYNELTDLINTEIDDTDSVITNTSALKTILSDIKNMFFANYGADTPEFGTNTDSFGDLDYSHANVTNNDKNIFNYGFNLDKSGHISLDTETFNKALAENSDDLKNLFSGVYENKGLGTQLVEYIDALDGFKGILSNYTEQMDSNKEDLQKERKSKIASLDSKYLTMAESFASYGALISQMEASFGGLSMMIKQSTSSN